MSASTETAPAGRLTGYHILAMFVAFFGVVIAVNLFMARQAISTFGGVVVENSYVASQHFNRWLDEAQTEQALGWKASLVRGSGDRVVMTLAGIPAGAVPSVAAVARHPLGRMPDHKLVFAALGDGRFVSTTPLPAGRWRLRMEVRADGHLWRQEGDVS